MKTCYIYPVGKVPKLDRTTYLKVTKDNLTEVYFQYRDLSISICILIQDSIPISSLLKLVEDYRGELSVVLHQSPDPVFLSRFPRVVYRLQPKPTDVFAPHSLDAMLKEAKEKCRSR